MKRAFYRYITGWRNRYTRKSHFIIDKYWTSIHDELYFACKHTHICTLKIDLYLKATESILHVRSRSLGLMSRKYYPQFASWRVMHSTQFEWYKPAAKLHLLGIQPTWVNFKYNSNSYHSLTSETTGKKFGDDPQYLDCLFFLACCMLVLGLMKNSRLPRLASRIL